MTYNTRGPSIACTPVVAVALLAFGRQQLKPFDDGILATSKILPFG
jgi:hypothetical protein